MCCNKKRAYFAAQAPMAGGPYYSERRGCGSSRGYCHGRPSLIRMLIGKAIERRNEKNAIRQQEQGRLPEAYQPQVIEKGQGYKYTTPQPRGGAAKAKSEYHGEEGYEFVEEAKDTNTRPELLPRYSQVIKS